MMIHPREAAGFALLLVACGPTPRPKAFDAQPELVCPGDAVSVTWSVEGPASLQAEPNPAGWEGSEIPSDGQRVVRPEVKTTLTLTALEGDPAKGDHFRRKIVQVKPVDDQRGRSATCDEATRKCTAKFELKASEGAYVVRLSDPKFVRAGKASPRVVCVTPPGATAQCVPEGGSAELRNAAGGEWTLTADLRQDELAKPPPQLRVNFDFGCPPRTAENTP